MMKISLNQSRWSKLLAFAGAGIAITLPLAIVVACGESAPAAPIDPKKAEHDFLTNTLLPAIGVDLAKSTPEALVWKSAVPALPTALAPNYESIEFAVDTLFNDVPAAEASRATGVWVTTLPTKTKALSAERYLWARLRPKDAQAFSYVAINLTASSEITKVAAAPVDTDSAAKASKYLDEEVGAKLRVTEGVKLSNISFTNVPTLPANFSNYVIEYSKDNVGNKEDALTKTNFTWALSTPPTTNYSIVGTDRYLWVRLRHKITAAYSAALDLSTLSGIRLVIDLDEYLKQVVTSQVGLALPTFSNDVKYSVTPAPLPPEYASEGKLEYALSDSALAADWTTTLPTIFSTSFNLRELWVRFIDKAGVVHKSAFSQLNLYAVLNPNQGQSFLADVADQFRYDVTLAASTKRVVTNKPALLAVSQIPQVGSTLSANYMGVEYSSFNFANKEDALADTNALNWGAAPERYDLRSQQRALWARLISRWPGKLPSLVQELTPTSRVRFLVATEADYDFVVEEYRAQLETLKANAGASPSQVQWTVDPRGVTLPAELSEAYRPVRFAFYSALPDDQWLEFADLPTTLNTDPMARHLYALLAPIDPANGQALRKVIDLTNSSGVQTLP